MDAGEYLDPLPQALLLTAIVIGFATVAFMLALIYRSWVLARQDELTDDEEDRRVAAAVGAYDPEEDAEVVSRPPSSPSTRTPTPALCAQSPARPGTPLKPRSSGRRKRPRCALRGRPSPPGGPSQAQG